jgi:DnaJ-class molecular chaperone
LFSHTQQRAKALHPDVNAHLAPAQAQEAFLRLVTACEVLSDEQQRRLYDAATDPALPRVLRRAAAAQQQQAADAAAAGSRRSSRRHTGVPSST